MNVISMSANTEYLDRPVLSGITWHVFNLFQDSSYAFAPSLQFAGRALFCLLADPFRRPDDPSDSDNTDAPVHSRRCSGRHPATHHQPGWPNSVRGTHRGRSDRKSTRLNSSH